MPRPKKTVKQPVMKFGISERVQEVAAYLWAEFPQMKPIGEIRQRQHMSELELLLLTVTESDLHKMIKVLGGDKFRKDWVSSLERIAEELPRIRSYLSENAVVGTHGFVARWREEQQS